PLIVRPLSKIWRSLCGIAWPLVYIISLFLDVETLLCLGTNLACWPSVTDAYDYLILGSKVEGWVLWPYTIRVAISILVIVIILTTLALVMSRKATKTRASETNERSGGGAAQKEQHPN
ncbi:MAG: hypothetical protein M1368_08355, partial [Thaumarchaeota archaeon]|nr:hypothetical protein [Nitrososphaerota archaeon]